MRQSRLLRIFDIIGRLTAILLVVMALALAFLIITQRVFIPFHVVVSDSMAPQIKTGDAVVMKDLEASDVKPGDVIVFRDPEDKADLVIHRVVAVEEQGGVRFFQTKGDNNKENDNWRVSAGELLGGVAMNVPGFGSFLDFMTTSRGYTSLIVIPAAASLLLAMLLGFGEKLSGMSRRDSAVRPPA